MPITYKEEETKETNKPEQQTVGWQDGTWEYVGVIKINQEIEREWSGLYISCFWLIKDNGLLAHIHMLY